MALVVNTHEVYEQAYVLADAGYFLFFIEDQADMLTVLEPMGFDAARHAFLQFRPKLPTGNEYLGKELCRIQPNKAHNVVAVYAMEAIDYRVNDTISQLRAACPDTPVTLTQAFRYSPIILAGRKGRNGGQESPAGTNAYV